MYRHKTVYTSLIRNTMYLKNNLQVVCRWSILSLVLLPYLANAQTSPPRNILQMLKVDQEWKADTYAAPGTREREYLDKAVKWLNQPQHSWEKVMVRWNGATEVANQREDGAYWGGRAYKHASANYFYALLAYKHPKTCEWFYRASDAFLAMLEGPGTDLDSARGRPRVRGNTGYEEYRMFLYGATGTDENGNFKSTDRTGTADPLEDGVVSSAVGLTALALYANRDLDERYEARANELIDYLLEEHIAKWTKFYSGRSAVSALNFDIIHWFAHPFTSLELSKIAAAYVKADQADRAVTEEPLYQEAKRALQRWRSAEYSKETLDQAEKSNFARVETADGTDAGLIWGQFVMQIYDATGGGDEYGQFPSYYNYADETYPNLYGINILMPELLSEQERADMALACNLGILNDKFTNPENRKIAGEVSGDGTLTPNWNRREDKRHKLSTITGMSALGAWDASGRIDQLMYDEWSREGKPVTMDGPVGNALYRNYWFKEVYPTLGAPVDPELPTEPVEPIEAVYAEVPAERAPSLEQAYWVGVPGYEFDDPTGRSDNQAEVKALWNEDSLILGVLVRDPSPLRALAGNAPWQNDAVQLLFDPNNTEGTDWDHHQLGHRQLIYDVGGKRYSYPQGFGDQCDLYWRPTSSGYFLEVRIPWKALGESITATAGLRIGFEVANDDLDGNQKTQFTYTGRVKDFRVPERFTTLTLGGAASAQEAPDRQTSTLVTGRQLTIYPNPLSKGNATLHLSGFGPAQVQITNLQGQVFYQAQQTDSYAELTHSLPPGRYVVRVSDAQGTLIKKLLVE